MFQGWTLNGEKRLDGVKLARNIFEKVFHQFTELVRGLFSFPEQITVVAFRPFQFKLLAACCLKEYFILEFLLN